MHLDAMQETPAEWHMTRRAKPLAKSLASFALTSTEYENAKDKTTTCCYVCSQPCVHLLSKSATDSRVDLEIEAAGGDTSTAGNHPYRGRSMSSPMSRLNTARDSSPAVRPSIEAAIDMAISSPPQSSTPAGTDSWG